MSKKVIFIFLLIIIFCLVFVYENTISQQKNLKGEYRLLLLTADPSEKRPGMGAVDMAFIILVKNGTIKQVLPIYPGSMSHPTAKPPEYLEKYQGVKKLYLHDVLWDRNPEIGSKLAQEIISYYTGIKTDIVVIVKPTAVDALISSVGPIYVPGEGYVNGNSITLLRNEQKNGMKRGNAVESLMYSLANASKDKEKYLKLLKVAIVELSQGNIVVIPKEFFIKFIIENGLNV
jgi:Protein of unknown function (DUF4012)